MIVLQFVFGGIGKEVVNCAVKVEANCFEVTETDVVLLISQQAGGGVRGDPTFLQKFVRVFDALLIA